MSPARTSVIRLREPSPMTIIVSAPTQCPNSMTLPFGNRHSLTPARQIGRSASGMRANSSIDFRTSVR